MKNTDALLNHLEANAREELAAQERFLALLDEQEQAIIAGSSAAVADVTKRLEKESPSAARRSTTRARLVKAIAEAWQVPIGAMTLGSIAERAGRHGERLSVLRDELRNKANEVGRKNRRVASVARLHHQVIREVINTIFRDDEGGYLDGEAAGTLIDAEA